MLTIVVLDKSIIPKYPTTVPPVIATTLAS